jgi:hypothetical protein
MTMIIARIVFAVATLTMSIGAAMAETNGYLYSDPTSPGMPAANSPSLPNTLTNSEPGGYVFPNPLPRWMPSTNAATRSGTPNAGGPETGLPAQGTTAIVGSHATTFKGTYLFPPNEAGGGSN